MAEAQSSSNGTPRASTAVRDPSVWEIYFPKKIEGHRDAVFVASFPPIIYFWPTLLTLFLCAFLQAVGMHPGWLFVTVLSLNVLVLVQDFDQKQFFIFVLLVLAALLGVWIINLYGFTFLKTITSWILSFDPQLTTDGYLLLGVILLVYFAWGLVTPLFNYWKLEQNEFIHYTQPIGKDMSIARMGCTLNKEIPDIIECAIAWGGGSLVIRRDSQIIATIPHIPFLGLRMEAIEHLLSETRVIVDQDSHVRP